MSECRKLRDHVPVSDCINHHAHLSIWRIIDIHELVNCPVEPSHEEHSQCQAVCEQHQGCVVPETACIDVSDHVILKDGHPVVHIRPACKPMRVNC